MKFRPKAVSHVLLAALATSALATTGFAQDNKPRYLIKFRPNVQNEIAREQLEMLDLKIGKYFGEIGVYLASPRNGSDFEAQGLVKLQNSKDVLYVEPSVEWHADDETSPSPTPTSSPTPPDEPTGPNDELYESQGGMHRINIEKAWNITTGSNEVIIAVSDSGIAMDHPDLVNQIWRNPKEIAENGLDDDNNGYIDDVNGWDFSDKDNDPTDGNSHGTHVAGIIGAEANNKIGIAGISWQVKLMPVRFLSNTGSGSTEGGIETILYATNNGAKIINASWGGGARSEALNDAITYAFSKGTLVICAAGNTTTDTDIKPHYPSSYESAGVLSVASSEEDGKLSRFSNFGLTNVDVVAPGSSIMSTVLKQKWGIKSGTSMATPMVSGMAALLLAKNPEITALELRNVIMNGVITRESYNGKIATGGDIDAFKTLELLDGGFQVWPAFTTLPLNRKFQFNAYGGTGRIVWASSDLSVASIDQTGMLTAKAKDGFVMVFATDESGKAVATQYIIVGKPDPNAKPQPPVSGGCAWMPKKRPETDPVQAGAALFNLALPFMFGAAARRRWAKK